MKLLLRYVLHMASIEKDGRVLFKFTRPLFVPSPLFCQISLKSSIIISKGTNEFSVLSISYNMQRSENDGWCYIMQFIGKLRKRILNGRGNSFYLMLSSLVWLIQVRPLTWLWHRFSPDLYLRFFSIPKHHALRTLKTYNKQIMEIKWQ